MLLYLCGIIHGILCSKHIHGQNILSIQALAQDQLRALLLMTKQFDVSLNVGVYDGDTSQGDRAWLRDNARLVIITCSLLLLSYATWTLHFS